MDGHQGQLSEKVRREPELAKGRLADSVPGGTQQQQRNRTPEVGKGLMPYRKK